MSGNGKGGDEQTTAAIDFGVTLPAWSVYVLGGLLIAISLSIPWLAKWQG